jgi:hypothetical protein
MTASDSQRTGPSVHGPLTWLNWQAELAGQPGRELSGMSVIMVALRPAWPCLGVVGLNLVEHIGLAAEHDGGG